MKFLLLLAVIAGLAWWVFGRRPNRDGRAATPPRSARGSDATKPQPMLVCAHCGVHLPRSEAVKDAADRTFCSEAHRLAGPR
jgi:uncharacterized protein